MQTAELDVIDAEYETWEAHSRNQAELYAAGNYGAACQADLCAEAALRSVSVMTDQLAASLVASCLASPAGMSATLADLPAIVARTDERLRRLRRAKQYDWQRIAFLEERKRRCERAVREIEGARDCSRSPARESARFLRQSS